MHAMESSGGGGGNDKKDSNVKHEDEDSRKSPKVPQSQQNGAALPEETASADRNLLHCPGSTPKKDRKGSFDGIEQPQVMLDHSWLFSNLAWKMF